MESTESREMTMEMREAFDIARKMEAYADACKCKMFIKTKTIAEAILAEKEAYADFWKIVTKTWPELRTKELTSRTDYSIIIK